MSHSFRGLFVASLALVGAVAFAAPAATGKPLTSSQQRMSDCSKQATGKKGDERKAFMSSCLKGSAAAPAKMTPQEKMKKCNADAGKQSLKGDARKTFMSTCLKG